ncbi:MAG: hypothetical protein SFV19_20110 [Rhodospirillaceae bacterium]|nr:hypothetical protein [Rhodospirillaceae bacterium]
MTTIPPTLTPQPAASTAATAGPVVTIPQPPPELLKLPPGTTLETVVLSVAQRPETSPDAPRTELPKTASPQAEPPPSPAPRPDTTAVDIARVALQRNEAQKAEAQRAAAAEIARQTVVLRTPAGDVQVRLPVPVDDGTRVALEVVRSTAGQITARIISIDDVPVQRVLAQAARAAASPSEAPPSPTSAPPPPSPALQAALRATAIPPGQAWTAAGPLSLTSVTPLSAYVLSTKPLAPLPAPLQPLFQPGADMGVRVVALQFPAPAMGAITPGPLKPAGTAPLAPGAPIIAAGQAPAASTPMGPTGANPPPTGAISSPLKPGATTPAQPNLSTPAVPSGGPTPTPQPGKGVVGGAAAPNFAGNPLPATGAIIATATPAPIQSTESQGLRLPTSQGLGAAPPAPPSSVETPSPIARITGQVIAAGAQTPLTIRTEAGDVQINIRANVPTGTTITLDVVALQPPRAETGPVTPPLPAPIAATFATPTTGWSSITEALQLLQRTDPQTAAQLAAAIPDGGPRTAAATMAFVQAMRSADPRQWPGDTALRGLERAGPRGAQLASQISSEVRELAGRGSDTGGEWRAYPVPWNAEGRIERINLVVRREGDGDEAEAKKGGKGGGTRFLVNLELSRLGEMQLDGMYRKAERGLDVMIRTKAALPDEMRRDLTGLYANSVSAMGLKGALSFQVAKKFADPMAATASPDKGGLWA